MEAEEVEENVCWSLEKGDAWGKYRGDDESMLEEWSVNEGDTGRHITAAEDIATRECAC